MKNGASKKIKSKNCNFDKLSFVSAIINRQGFQTFQGRKFTKHHETGRTQKNRQKRNRFSKISTIRKIAIYFGVFSKNTPSPKRNKEQFYIIAYAYEKRTRTR